MKIRIIISTLSLFMCLFVMGQSTVLTPWGTSVTVYSQGSMSYLQRVQSDLDHADAYPDADFLPTLPNGHPSDPSSTSQFNCHGYAWYMFWRGDDEFDDPWNMNQTEAEKYFEDPSYTACSLAEAEIWWINGGSHSALATETSGELLSKWDTGPLATHGTGYNDFPNAPIYSVTYYKKCYKEYSGTFGSDNTLDECSAQFEDSGISNYVDLEIEYEVAVRLVGTFSTGTGSTLYIHP